MERNARAGDSRGEAALFRKLGDDGGAEHQRAAQQLPGQQRLTQQHPAAQRGEDRLQAHQQRGQGGVGVLLTHHLQRVADGAGEHRHVEDAAPAGEHVLETRRFDDEGDHAGHHRAGGELQRAQDQRVAPRGVAADGEDLEGEHHGAAQGEQVADADGEVFLHAQQDHARQRQRQADPNRDADALPAEYSQQGHDDDVQRRHKAGFGGRGVDEAHLLEDGRGDEEQPDDDAGNEVLPQRRRAGLSVAGELPEQGHGRHQHRAGDGRAQEYKGEGLYVEHGVALGGKGQAPDQRRGQQAEGSL